MEGRVTPLLYLLVLANLSVISGTWLTSMIDVCGDAVNDLYIAPGDYQGHKARCRPMRKALQCVKKTSQTDLDLLQAWRNMQRTGVANNMEKNVNNTCQKEARQLCVTYTIQEDMRNCYQLTGLTPRETFTTEFLSQNCYPMRDALSCMRRRLLLCPDDDYIQPQVQGLDTWIDQLHDACPGMPRLIRVTQSGATVVDDYNLSGSCVPRNSCLLTFTLLLLATCVCL